MRNCIDENEALAYRSEALSTESRQAIEEHVSICSTCLELMLALSADRREDTLPSRPVSPRLVSPEKIANYTILEEVGSGGMGVVYAAYDLELDRRVALKVVRRGGQAASERIRREAQAMARLSHPNVITVYGVHPLPDDEVVIAMEYVAGKSLRNWLAERPRADWTTIQKVFVQAAAGLAAAHEAGLVHRDFKPDNLLVTEDGQAKVIDFGLVGSAGEVIPSTPEELTSNSVPFSSLTQEGAFIGTPAYMAPEHLKKGAIDSRTDQFAFCVTLFEAVYGQRPFPGRTYEEIRQKLVDGHLEVPDRPPGVPRSVEGLLRRGLSTDPDERFASMRELMVALERATEGPPWHRNKILWAAVAVVVVAGALVAPREPLCPTPQEAFADFWASSAKVDIREAFISTGLGYAEDTWDRVVPRLDAFVSSWRSMHVESCEATLVRHDQTEHVHSLRKVCLQQKKEQFRSVVQRLRSATPNVVDRAAELVSGFSLDRCQDATALLAVPPPESPAVSESVAKVRSAVIQLGVQYEVAAYDEGLTSSEVVVRDAEATGYPAVIAEALYWRGVFLHRTHDYAESVAVLERAYGIALEANHLDLAADASRELTWVAGYFLAKPELGFQWSITARGLARLRDAGGPREAHSLGRLGKLEAFMGRSRAAQTHLLAAETMYRRHLGDAHPKLGAVVMDLGTSFFGEGRYEDALVHYRRALEIHRATYGPRHIRVARAHQNVGIALINLQLWAEAEQSLELAREIYARSGKGATYEEGMLFHNLGQLAKRLGRTSVAIARYSRSLKVLRETLGTDHPRTSPPLRGLGDVTLAEGDVAGAIEYLEQALRVASGEGHDPGYRANAEFSLARALDQANKKRRARRLAVSALDRYRKRGLSEDADRVRGWLVEHGYKKAPP